MAKELAEGFFPCIVLDAKAGFDEDKEQILVRVNVKLDDGPDKGKLTTYEDGVNEKSSLYVRRSCNAIGWKGVSLDTLTADVAAWIEKTGGKTTVEIKHIPTKKGTIWAKANSLGRGPKPLATPPKSALADADAAMRRAAEADGSAPPLDDAPHAAGGAEEDIPFIRAAFVRDENGQVL